MRHLILSWCNDKLHSYCGKSKPTTEDYIRKLFNNKKTEEWTWFPWLSDCKECRKKYGKLYVLNKIKDMG